jgi:hypothetical protein
MNGDSKLWGISFARCKMIRSIPAQPKYLWTQVEAVSNSGTFEFLYDFSTDLTSVPTFRIESF